jgi:DNA-binding transcriptional regulator YdaS (Cro superfamily)
MGRGDHTALNRERVQVLSRLADAGENMTRAAAVLGISGASLTQWFDRHGYDGLRGRLKDNRSANATPESEAVRRLRAVARAGSINEAARSLGLSGPGLWLWLSRNAPDGVQDALGDWI